MPPAGGRGGWLTVRLSERFCFFEMLHTPLCLLPQTSPPQGGRGALRQNESPILLHASNVITTPPQGIGLLTHTLILFI